MSLLKRALKGFFWNQASKILELGLILLFSIVIARELGASQYGIYAILTSVCSFFLLVSALGFEEVANTYIPKLLDEKGKTAYLLKRLIFIRSFVIFIFGLVLYFMSGLIARIVNNPDLSGYLKLAIFYVIFSSISNLFLFFFIGQIRIKVTFLVKITVRVLNLVLAYIFLKLGFGIVALIYILTFTAFLSVIIYLFQSRRDIFRRSEKFAIQSIYKFGRTLWLTNFVNYALGKQTDILLLGFFLVGTSQIGYYNIAFTLAVSLSTLLLGGLGGVGLSAFSEIEAKHDRKSLGLAWGTTIKIASLLSVPVTIFAIYFAKPIITLFYSDAYLPAAILFQIFASFGVIGRLLGGGTSYTVLCAINKEKIVFYLRLLAGLLNLILDILLIPKYGALGAIIATGSSGIIVVALELGYVKKYVQVKFPLIFVAKVITICVLALVISMFAPVKNAFSLIKVGVLYGVIGIILLYLIKPFANEDQELLIKLNKKIGKFMTTLVSA